MFSRPMASTLLSSLIWRSFDSAAFNSGFLGNQLFAEHLVCAVQGKSQEIS